MHALLHFLLNIAHFLYSLYLYLQERCVSLMLAIKHGVYFKKIYNSYSLKSNNHLLAVSKIPRHLAILLGQEEISTVDLMKIISWCIAAEIPYVSFYDHRGILQKNQSLVKKELDELEPLITQYVEWSDFSNRVDDNTKTIAETNNLETNVICTNVIHANATDVINKPKTKIQVLSYADGKDKIIALTKSLARVANTNHIQERDITSEWLDEKLNLNVKIPDPDLAIVFGKTMCNYGFLPWQAKITEFFVIPSHNDVSSNSFMKTLISFSECQQRYGK